MQVISINRKVFNQLKSNTEALDLYLSELIQLVDSQEEAVEGWNEIIRGLRQVITKNEELISEVGMKAYYNDNYPVSKHVSGCYYSTGQYGIIPFDWSMSDETDEDWTYTFNVFKVL